MTPSDHAQPSTSAPSGACLLHVPDLHFGRADPAAIGALRAAIERIDPDLVIAAGDLTQRARAGQFRAARAFLDALPAPWLAVPGNHDVPLWDLVRRVFSPLGRYHRFITEDRAPRREVHGVRVLGLDSTRRKVTGRLKAEQIALIHDADVLVTHHPLVRRPLENAEAALAAARRAGVAIVLAGHHHHLHITDGDPVAVEAPTPSHKLEPKKGFVVVRMSAAEIVVEPWWLTGAAYVADPSRTFRRNPGVTRR
jgi:3',5'-cyclic AMP phosphodiesterase CpdA